MASQTNACAGDVRLVVLDEADKMLSLGFEPQLTRLRRRLCPPHSRAPPSYQRPQVVPAAEPLVAHLRSAVRGLRLDKSTLTLDRPWITRDDDKANCLPSCCVNPAERIGGEFEVTGFARF